MLHELHLFLRAKFSLLINVMNENMNEIHLVKLFFYHYWLSCNDMQDIERQKVNFSGLEKMYCQHNSISVL